MEKYLLELDEEKNKRREDLSTLDHVKDSKGEACYSGKINMLLLNKMYEVLDFLSNDESCFIADESLNNNLYKVTFEDNEKLHKTIIENKETKIRLEFLKSFSEDGNRRRYRFSFDEENWEIQENKDIWDFEIKDKVQCTFFDMFNLSYFTKAISDCRKKYDFLKNHKRKSDSINKEKINNDENKSKSQEEQNKKQALLRNKLSGF